jgi:hypothetical protein
MGLVDLAEASIGLEIKLVLGLENLTWNEETMWQESW